MDKPQTTPKQKLVDALCDARAPQPFIDRALNGYYGDFTSPLPTPISQLVADARTHGLNDIAKRAMNGDFDG